MSVYGHILNESSFASLLSHCNNKDEKEYYNKIKSNISWIEKLLNKCSEEAFKTFADDMKEKLDDDEYELYDIDSFKKYNTKAPIVDWQWVDKYIEFRFKVQGCSSDTEKIYQDYVMNNYIKKYYDKFKSSDIGLSQHDQTGVMIKYKEN